MQIPGSVVVVTGASSGIGRATALRLAEEGARTVLVARRAAELDALAAECDRRGTAGSSLAVAADVSDADAVEQVAVRAVQRFSRIDGWVSAAAVTGFGPLLDTPLADVERVFAVNVMGALHGARSVLPRMTAQGSGVLVNVSSLLGVVAPPLAGPYAMSKFALRALGATLRAELRGSGAGGVHVSTVLPAAVDTPIYAAAYNRTGRRLRPPPPVYSVDRVAGVVVGALRRPRAEVIAGGVLGRMFAASYAVAPRVAEWAMAVDTGLALRHGGEVADTDGTLYRPAPGPGTAEGGWDGPGRERRRRRAAVAALAGGALVAGLRWAA